MTKFVFDVDGTLTPSRQRIDKDFAVWFSHFCEDNEVYLITGSDRDKTIEQVGEYIYNKCKKVYNCSGNDVYVGDLNVYRSDWTLPDLARTFLISCEYESDFSIRTGNHIEERPGMVNFSVVGRNATQEQRAAYVDFEAQNGERRKIADAFNTMFPDLSATVGGETGIDIAPKGLDKSQILKNFSNDDRIIFFGDAMHKGGNDYPLANALSSSNRGTSYTVTGWEHTWNILKEITK